MRYWIGLLVVGCAAIAVLTLPPTSTQYALRSLPFDGLDVARMPEGRRVLELENERRVLIESLQRLRFADSLSALAMGAADLPDPVVVGVPALTAERTPFRAEAVRVASDNVLDELRHIGVLRPSVDLGVFLVSGSTRGIAPAVDRVEWYAGTRGGRPYCISVRMSLKPYVVEADLLSFSWRPEEPNGRTEILGPCGFYARYGMPSATIQAWMQGPGAALAAERSVRERILSDEPARRSMFGDRSSTEIRDLQTEGCAVGRASACAATLFVERSEGWDLSERLEPAMVANGVPILDGRPNSRATSSLAEYSSPRMLDAIEQRFGADAFAAFWRADLPVAEAFTTAFGMTPTEWGREWTRMVYGEAARAPVFPRFGEWMLGLAYVAAGVLLAAWVLRERRMG